MDNVLSGSLFERQEKRFRQMEDLSRKFAGAYSGNTIIRDNIFSVIENYARKKESPLEMLRYPFRDDELWAFTFVKKGIVFVCVNSDLALCKQNFAVAHELYHFICYAENEEQHAIREGSWLDFGTVNDAGKTQEDLEANAFAGLLMMPENLLSEQLSIYGISRKKIRVDDVLCLMDVFALPYKAVILRLYECGYISLKHAGLLLEVDATEIAGRIGLTGKAKRWQLSGSGMERFGSLEENIAFNSEHELLTDSRESSDKKRIRKIKSLYGLE